jgi:hypothetical protein
MDRHPIFHKENKKIQQMDFAKNIWCPYYDECLDEAAASNALMDCCECANLNIDFKDEWGARYSFCALRYNL